MFDLLLACFLFLFFSIISLLITYIIFVLLDQSNAQEEPSLNAVIMTQLTLIYNKVMETVGKTVEKITQEGLRFADNISSNGVFLLKMFLFLGFVYTYTNNKVPVLQGIDKFWRCALAPLLDNVLMNLLIIIRAVFNLFVPLYNFYQLVIAQIFSGTATTVLKCDLINFLDTIRLMFNVFIAQFNSVAAWSGMAGEMSLTNNIFANEFNITKIVWNTQLVIIKQENITKCVCDGMTDVIGIAMVLVKQREIAHFINHVFNIPISLIQEVALVAPPFKKFPRFVRPFNHLTGAVFNFGKYFDNVLVQITQQVINLFSDNFQLTGMPPEFIFVSTARFINAALHLGFTAIKILTHVLMPNPKFFQNSDYMINVFSIDLAVEQYQIALRSVTNDFAFGLRVGQMFTTNSLAARNTIAEYTELECNGMYIDPASNLACGFYYTFKAPVDWAQLAWKLFNELLWKVIFNPEEDFLRVIQRYDGISFPRQNSTYTNALVASNPSLAPNQLLYLTCDYRSKIDFDLTAGLCQCVPNYNYRGIVPTRRYPFGAPQYLPNCQQPNLQVNLFNVADMLSDYASQGISSSLQRLIRVQQRTVFELYKTAIKFVLNFNNIVGGGQGAFWHRKNNCGYGLTRPQLRHWFNTTFEPGDFTLANKISTYQTSEVCDGPNMLSPLTEVNGGRKCKRIDDSIVDYMCAATTYSRGARICTSTNTAGCYCNHELPLDFTSPCMCIAHFPDTDVVAGENGISNTALTQLYESSTHWCNTYWLENVYRELNSIADTVELIFQSLGVGTSQCTLYNLKNYRIGNNYNRQLNCQVKAAYNANCAIILTLRSTTDVVINEMRAITMGVVEIINLDFSQLKITFTERLCEIQRIAAAVSSLLPSFIPLKMGTTLQRGLTKILYQQLAFPILVLDVVNYLLSWLQQLVTGRLDFRSPEKPFTDLLITLVGKGIDYFVDWLDAFKDTLNGVRSGSGKFIDTIEKIVRIIQTMFLNEAMRDLLITLFNIATTTLELFLSPSSVNFGEYFNNIWVFVTKLLKVLLANVGRVFGAILDLLGGAGKFIRVIGGTICGAIQDALCGMTKFLMIKPPLCSLGCFARNLRSNGTASFYPKTSHHIENAPMLISQFDWSGTSECDYLVNNYKEYQWSELRPIEEYALLDCLQSKLIALKLANTTNLPIPEDILYNWKSKYLFGFKVAKFLGIFIQQKLGYMTVSSMITTLKRENLLGFLEPTQDIVRLLPMIVASSNIKSFVQDVAKIMDDDFDPHTYQNTGTHAAYRVAVAATDTLSAVADTAKKHDIYRQANFALATVTSFNAEPIVSYNFGQFIPNVTGIVDRKPLKRSYLKTRILRAAGIQTGTTPCEERSNSYVCINCLVIDNALNAFIDAAIELKNYYQYVYVHQTVPSFTNYWKDMNVNITITPPAPVAIQFDYTYLAWKMDPLTIQLKQVSMPDFDPNIDLKLFDPITFDPITLDPISFEPINFEVDPILMPTFKTPKFPNFGKPNFDIDLDINFDPTFESFNINAKDLIPELDPITEESLQGSLNNASADVKERVENSMDRESKFETTLNPNLRSTLNRSHPHFRLRSTHALKNISEYDKAHKDWIWFFNHPNIFANYSSDPEVRDGFYDVLFKFLTTTDEEYVQYFAHGLPWYIKQPIVLQCPMDRMYCMESTTSERLDKMTESFWYFGYVIAAIMVVQILTSVPLLAFVSPYLFLAFGFIYMYTVYTYTYPCFPSVPQCFFDDMFAYLNDRLILDCFCSYLPSISETCAPQSCFMCSKSTLFDTCSDVVELKDELGVLWAPLFYLRKYYPDVIIFFHKQIPFSWFSRRWGNFVTTARFIIEEVPITGEENDCLILAYGDFLFIGVSLILVITAAKLTLPLTIQLYNLANQLLMLSITTLYSMCLAIELQTINVD